MCLNNQKLEIICDDPVPRRTIITTLPRVRIVDPSSADLQSSPLRSSKCTSVALKDKISALVVMGSRFQHIIDDDGSLLLKSTFSISKLVYTLRTSPCFTSADLIAYDVMLSPHLVIRLTFIFVMKIQLGHKQLYLLNMVNLRLLKVVQHISSSYLASAGAYSGLISYI